MRKRGASVPVEAWTDQRHVRGYLGERAALQYLRARGWRIEAHRWRVGHHDVDLVLRRGTLVAFVEVKTRTGVAAGRPAQAVGRARQRVLVRLAALWASMKGCPGDQYRFDVVAVEWPPGHAPRITHLPDAWRG